MWVIPAQTVSGRRCAPAVFLWLLLVVLSTAALPVSAAELTLQLQTSRWLYQEFDAAHQELNRESGYLPGLQFRWRQALSRHWGVQLQAGRSRGVLTYNGQTQAGSAYRTDTQEGVSQLDATLWYQPPDSRWQLSAGLGQSVWQRHIRSRGNTLALHERYQWRKLSAGLEYRWPWSSRLSLALGATGSLLWHGQLQVELQSLGYGTPLVPLKNGRQISAQLGIAYQLTSAWQLQLGHQQQQHWFPRSRRVAASNGQNQVFLHEPENQNRQQIWFIAVAHPF